MLSFYLEESEREGDGEAAFHSDYPNALFVGPVWLRIVGARELSGIATYLAAAHH